MADVQATSFSGANFGRDVPDAPDSNPPYGGLALGLRAIAVFTGTIAAAVASWHVIERPVQLWVRRRSEPAVG